MGFPSGSAPAEMALISGHNKEVFLGAWWKPSSPWQDPNGNSTIVIALAPADGNTQAVFVELTATGGTPAHRVDVFTQFSGMASLDLTPNTDTSDVSLGSWHQVELYLKYSTSPTSGDGIIRWWLDGVLQGDYSNQNMPSDSGIAGYYIQPSKVGSNNSTEADDFWYDQVHVGIPSATPWPDEPAGFTRIDDYGFPDSIPASNTEQVIPGGSGWRSIFNSTGSDGAWNTTRVDDAGAPFSPTSVVQWRYPSGFGGGSAPGTLFYDHTSQTEVFAGFWWKPSNPWQNHASSNVNKIAFWGTGGSGSSIDIQMYGIGGDTAYELQVVSEFTGVTTTRFAPNLTATHIALGQWHRVEWHMKYATTPGGSDGVLEWWLDGVPQARYTNMQTPNDSGFFEFKLSPTWGGTGGQKSETDYYWVDQVHLSHG